MWQPPALPERLPIFFRHKLEVGPTLMWTLHHYSTILAMVIHENKKPKTNNRNRAGVGGSQERPACPSAPCPVLTPAVSCRELRGRGLAGGPACPSAPCPVLTPAVSCRELRGRGLAGETCMPVRTLHCVNTCRIPPGVEG